MRALYHDTPCTTRLVDIGMSFHSIMRHMRVMHHYATNELGPGLPTNFGWLWLVSLVHSSYCSIATERAPSVRHEFLSLNVGQQQFCIDVLWSSAQFLSCSRWFHPCERISRATAPLQNDCLMYRSFVKSYLVVRKDNTSHILLISLLWQSETLKFIVSTKSWRVHILQLA